MDAASDRIGVHEQKGQIQGDADNPLYFGRAVGRWEGDAFDGKLANLGSYNRTCSGTWTDGATKGDFKLMRD